MNAVESLDAALACGADMIGLVFFPRSPRHVSVAAAKGLRQHVRGRAEVVALTVDADDALIDAICAEVRPDWLQLHGQESGGRLAALRARCRVRSMKALGIAAAADLAAAAAFTAADRLLLDAKPPQDATRPGGNGARFDWRLIAAAELPPFMLSGGLTAANVAEAIAEVGGHGSFVGVDVSSGVEAAPGVKDPVLIEAFIRAARSARPMRKDKVA
ncbi:N-(5'-phosphoribosyl)anthranilate isomerase [Chelatococcus reniformis]|uniref:N-(5'-phosphoribosyl)anthranilate isomerase n=1 Tax=Chelatococcus reniformis TaxID=1494448 RepID=A0A916TW55_9HYPH|nr:N-(5'-phosphoribosyl)anthranilate isomerase [Chelatococcus reniformis]